MGNPHLLDQLSAERGRRRPPPLQGSLTFVPSEAIADLMGKFRIHDVLPIYLVCVNFIEQFQLYYG